jgi:hypothetical protein
MSPRRNCDSPTPSLASECAPPPGTKGGGGGVAHSPAGEWLWKSQFRRLEKSLALCLLVTIGTLGFGTIHLNHIRMTVVFATAFASVYV